MKKFRVVVQEFDADHFAHAFMADQFNEKAAKKVFGTYTPGFLIRLREGHHELCSDFNWWVKQGIYQLDVYKKNKKKIKKERKTHLKHFNKMSLLHKKFNSINFLRISSKKISDYFDLIYKYNREMLFSGWSFLLIDFPGNHLTNYLNKRLNELVSGRKLSKRTANYFSVLTNPFEDTEISKERKELLKLALKFRKKKLSRKRKNKLLEEHKRKYSWITFGFKGPERKIDFYEKEINDLIKTGELEYNLSKLKTEKKELIKETKKAKKELKLSKEDEYLFDLAREFVFLKAVRKEMMILSFYLISKLLNEVAKRSFVSKNLLHYLSRKEMKEFLVKQIPFNEKELLKRSKFMVVVSGIGYYDVFTGEKARKKFHTFVLMEKTARKKNELNGQIASPGLVKGIVKRVDFAGEMDKLFKGEIMVSVTTQPELLPAMKRTAGIITEQGGITSHAAIVSRELNTPCVIGVKKVTKLLKDGDKVELDAYHGIIRVLKRVKK